ncbi:hypothetical protein [Cerasicoccus fimbriatus]|uniref:hypothetical protein n=1 Tax=Cerasicoccus fimbriatus TaxID=3014554 RepID=UPI0022B5B28B|nr:hypothetical protein [Cerasicoccus sp. TK19100]
MIKAIFTILIASFTLASISTTSAQVNRDIPTQKVSAVLLENRSKNQELYYLDLLDEYRPFQVGMMSRGGGNIQALSNQLNLFAKSINEDGDEVYTPAIVLDIPKVSQVLILFYYDNKRNLNYRIYDDTLEAHPRGTGRLINLTDSDIIGKVADEQFQIKPWGALITNPLIKNQRTRFQFGYVIETNGKFNADPSIDTFRIPNQKMRWLAVFTYFDHKESSENGKEFIITRLPSVIRMLDAPPPQPGEEGYAATN